MPSIKEYIARDVIPTGSKQQALVFDFPYAAIIGSLLYIAVEYT